MVVETSVANNMIFFNQVILEKLFRSVLHDEKKTREMRRAKSELKTTFTREMLDSNKQMLHGLTCL